MNKEGNLFVISAPSGTGKTSLVNALEERVDEIKVSTSYTTRPPRPGDCDGDDYFFVDGDSFQHMVADHAFLEHAEIYGHHYGTAKAWVMSQLQDGFDVLLEIDWQGARQIRKLFPPALSIFIFPPSISALQDRLVKRRQDKQNVIEERLALAKAEMQHYHEFDYLVVNDDFERALADLICIIRAERLQLDVQQRVASELLVELL